MLDIHVSYKKHRETVLRIFLTASVLSFSLITLASLLDKPLPIKPWESNDCYTPFSLNKALRINRKSKWNPNPNSRNILFQEERERCHDIGKFIDFARFARKTQSSPIIFVVHGPDRTKNNQLAENIGKSIGKCHPDGLVHGLDNARFMNRLSQVTMVLTDAVQYSRPN